jgi:amino acid transporter
MNQTKRLANAKVYSVFGVLLAIAAFFSSLGVFISLWSVWVEWWVYIVIAAIAIAGFLTGYIARRDLKDLDAYSPLYQGAAVISLGCSPLTLLILASLFFLALSSVP